MPCVDVPPSDSEYSDYIIDKIKYDLVMKNLTERLNDVTRYLCHIMNGNDPTEEIKRWFELHKIADLKRLRDEENKLKIEEFKKEFERKVSELKNAT